VRAAIFDMDGTLIDSVDQHALAWQDVFREFGHEIPYKKIRDQIGKGSDQFLPVFLSRTEVHESGERIADRRTEIFMQTYLPQVKPFPKVRELFERLIADGVRVALASSAKSDELETFKKIAGIEDLVPVETSSDDAERSKPFPDIFEAALRKLHDVKAHDAIALGDTPYDAQAAAKAGIRTIGFLCGGWPEEELRRAGCFAIYRDPAHLLANYDTSPFAIQQETRRE
jgi:HAD superfamily hydrolase (TIGR01509 family)